ncbi:MAG: zinc ribbon domain-containing protein, partial [Oscillospiraceae bacterium]|nr:zinc ribbon domain-containing protein [Oscillospiraceae bacterium]
MYCRNCGAELPDNAVICTRCGAAVANDAPVNETQNPHGPEQNAGWNGRDHNSQYGPGQYPGQPYPPQWQPPVQGYYGPQFQNGASASYEEIRHAA